MDSKYLCLIWHELTQDEREAAMARLRLQLSPMAFRRLSTIIKIHGGIKFVGSYGELEILSGILNSSERQSEYNALLMDIAARIAKAPATGYSYAPQTLNNEYSWLPDEHSKILVEIIKLKNYEALLAGNALPTGKYWRAVDSSSWSSKMNRLWCNDRAGEKAAKIYQDYLKNKHQRSECFLDEVKSHLNRETVVLVASMLNDIQLEEQRTKFLELIAKGPISDALVYARDCNLPVDWLVMAVEDFGERQVKVYVNAGKFSDARELVAQCADTVSKEKISAWSQSITTNERLRLLQLAEGLVSKGDIVGLTEIQAQHKLFPPADFAGYCQQTVEVNLNKFLRDNRHALAREFLLSHQKYLASKYYDEKSETIIELEFKYWIRRLESDVGASRSLSAIQNLLRHNSPPPLGFLESSWFEFVGLITSISLGNAEEIISKEPSALDVHAGRSLLKTGKPELSREWLAFKARVLVVVRTRLIEDLLGAALEEQKWVDFDKRLLKLRLDATERENWLTRKAGAIAEKLKPELRLDSDQARILASPAKTIRVTARAGAGKTGILKALAFFLIDQCGYQADEVLLLAFNRRNADELENHLINLLKVPAFPGARTFHALANGIAQPEEKVLTNQGEEVQAQQLTRCIQDILRSRIDDALRKKIHQVFRGSSVDKTYDALLSGKTRYDYRRALKRYTLGGCLVKSAGEKYIGDFLFEHGITHYYEDCFWWDRGLYRPDFKIMVGEKDYVIWEHWAVDPDAEYSASPDDWSERKVREYMASAKRKRDYWRTKKIPLIETCAADCANREQFEVKLARLLRPYLLTMFPALDRYFDANQEFEIIKRDARMKRWLTSGFRWQLLMKSGFLHKKIRDTKKLKRRGDLSEREKALLNAAFTRALKGGRLI